MKMNSQGEKPLKMPLFPAKIHDLHLKSSIPSKSVTQGFQEEVLADS
jgi:hypothetical protein